MDESLGEAIVKFPENGFIRPSKAGLYEQGVRVEGGWNGSRCNLEIGRPSGIPRKRERKGGVEGCANSLEKRESSGEGWEGKKQRLTTRGKYKDRLVESQMYFGKGSRGMKRTEESRRSSHVLSTRSHLFDSYFYLYFFSIFILFLFLSLSWYFHFAFLSSLFFVRRSYASQCPLIFMTSFTRNSTFFSIFFDTITHMGFDNAPIDSLHPSLVFFGNKGCFLVRVDSRVCILLGIMALIPPYPTDPLFTSQNQPNLPSHRVVNLFLKPSYPFHPLFTSGKHPPRRF